MAARSQSNDSPKQALLLGLLIFLVFGLAFWAPFIYDDVPFISTNPDVIGAWRGWRHFFLHPRYFQEGYEPVSLLLHRVLFLIGGAHPALFRLSNVLLHWAVCVLVLLLFKRLLGPKSPAFWLAALFAIFPSHTENIAVATFKKHILVSFFGLLMLFAHRPWNDEKVPWRRQAACGLFLVLSLFSKENGAVFPAVLAAFSLSLASDWKARLRRDAPLLAGLFGVDLAFVYWRAVVVPRSGAALVGDSPVTHLLTCAKCLVWYMREFFLPVRLCQEHSISPLTLSWSWQLPIVLAVLASLAAFAAWLWRRDRVAFAGLALALLWILPFLNLIPFLNLSLVANRYIYLSMAGALLCAGSLSRPWWDKRIGRFKAVPLACAAVGLAYAALAMNNLAHYSDPLEVWERAACCAPGNPRAHSALAAAYAQAGRYADSERELRAAARIDAGDFNLSVAAALGSLWAQTGRLDRAQFLYASMVRRYPGILPFGALGTGLLAAGRVKEAVVAFRQALLINPRDSFSRLNLGLCYARLGQSRLARIQWTAASADPATKAAADKDLATLSMREGCLVAARRQLQDSLQADSLQIDVIGELADLDAREGRPQAGLARLDDLVRRLRRGQKAAFSAAAGLTSAQLDTAAQAVAAALKQRERFLTKHPRALAAKG